MFKEIIVQRYLDILRSVMYVIGSEHEAQTNWREGKERSDRLQRAPATFVLLILFTAPPVRRTVCSLSYAARFQHLVLERDGEGESWRERQAAAAVLNLGGLKYYIFASFFFGYPNRICFSEIYSFF